MIPTKTNIKNNTKIRKNQRNRHLDKKLILGVVRIFFLYFLKWFLQEMLSYRLGTVNDFHWGFKPILIYSKPRTFSTFLEKKKKKICIYFLQPNTI